MRTLLLACVLAATAATPALARPGAETAAIAVTINDRDLATAEGLARLHARIERAARRVCGYEGRVLPLYEHRARAACIEARMTHAIQTANVPALTALHATLRQTGPG
ncbi:MAG: UrcA family protein [Hyphomonadaceae bacterium]|nr:UrcA family protein [Hyphomonadaceae bacterium]